MKVIILGATGMLGSMMARVMPEARTPDRKEVDAFNHQLVNYDEQVINCIGLIKPRIKHTIDAIIVNAEFPYMLPAGTIQIATDCVYSGKKGNYIETDPHDALDVYGKTKSLGEALHIKNLRCSIIGPELKNHDSLLDWFLAQESAQGYTNHRWNGITTYHFSKICQGIIKEGIELPNVQHIVPADIVTKAELLEIIAKAYDKGIPIKRIEAPEAIDRTLSTVNPQLNSDIWEAAGYPQIPTVEEMVTELASL